MKPAEITHFASIYATDLHKDTFNFLQDNCITYQDQVLKEHLYNISDMDEINEWEPEPHVKEEIEKLNKMCAHYDCAYLRVIPQG